MKYNFLYITLWLVYLNMYAEQQPVIQVQTQTSAQQLLRLLEQEFKKPDYIRDLLPNDFSHVINLLRYGKDTHQPISYAQAVLNPFTNMLKGSEYVNHEALLTLLNELPSVCQHYFTPTMSKSFLQTHELQLEAYERLQVTVDRMLYQNFSTQFDYFKQNPELFLNQLSCSIRDIAHEELDMQYLRHALMRFLDTCLSKTLWNPIDQTLCWKSFMTIAQRLSTLKNAGIISDITELDNLYWTLIHRFAYFLDLTSPHLNVETFIYMKQELTQKPTPLFDLEEQDSWIETKQHFFMRSLLKAEATCRAYNGIHQAALPVAS